MKIDYPVSSGKKGLFEQMEKRICKKCLLRDMEQSEQLQSVQDYINSLDETKKISDEKYEQRLNVCRECEYLLAGMCRSCGCYVELRAILSDNTCPRKYW